MNDGEIRLTDVESPRWITDVHEVRGGPGTVVGGMVVGGDVVGGDVRRGRRQRGGRECRLRRRRDEGRVATERQLGRR